MIFKRTFEEKWQLAHVYQPITRVFKQDLQLHYYPALLVQSIHPRALTYHRPIHLSLNQNPLRQVLLVLDISSILPPNRQHFLFWFDSMSQNLSAILKAKDARLIMFLILNGLIVEREIWECSKCCHAIFHSIFRKLNCSCCVFKKK